MFMSCAYPEMSCFEGDSCGYFSLFIIMSVYKVLSTLLGHVAGVQKMLPITMLG